jgi:hypothetical protein
MIVLSACFLFVLACSSPPILTLIPSTSNLSFPLQFRRSEDFFVSSTIELNNCSVSQSMIMKWTLKNCSSSSCVNSFPLDSTVIETTFADFYVPSRTLPFGLFELTLTVTLKLTLTMNLSSRLTSASKSAYVRITPSGLMANLIPLGTSMITSGSGQDLQFNPGLYSVDLDEDHFNASVSLLSLCL